MCVCVLIFFAFERRREIEDRRREMKIGEEKIEEVKNILSTHPTSLWKLLSSILTLLLFQNTLLF